MEQKSGKYAARSRTTGSSRSKGGRFAAAKEKKTRKKRTLKGFLLFLIPAVAVVATAVVMLLVVEHGSSFTFSATGTQYYAGAKSKVQTGAKLTTQADGTVTLDQGGMTGALDLPVYTDGKQEMVLSRDMTFYAPRSGSNGRVFRFSTIGVLESGTVTMVREGSNQQLEKGFLYDGKDIYVFLEPMTVKFNGYELEVPALSYVEAIYGGNIMLFDYGTKECTMEASEGSATAAAVSGEYEISLFGDHMTAVSGEKTLLMSRTDLVDPIQ